MWSKHKYFIGMAGLFLALALCLPQMVQRVEATDDLDQAMQNLIQAVRGRNSQGVLAAFSRTAPWLYVQYTIGTNHVSQKTVVYGKVQRDFKARKGWYEFFMIDKTEGTERPLGSRTPTKWHRRGTTFLVNPEYPNAFYFKWRKEGGRWVIAEIGESGD